MIQGKHYEMGKDGGLVELVSHFDDLTPGSVIEWGGNAGFPETRFCILSRVELSNGEVMYDCFNMGDTGKNSHLHRVEAHSIKAENDPALWHSQHYFIQPETVPSNVLERYKDMHELQRIALDMKTAKDNAESDRLEALGRELWPALIGDCPAVIVAEQHKDVSDSMTDYFASHVTDCVILAPSNKTEIPEGYPDVTPILETLQHPVTTLIVSAVSLMRAVKSLKAVSKQGEGWITFHSNGALELTTESDNAGKSRASVEILNSTGEAEFTIQCQYVLDALTHVCPKSKNAKRAGLIPQTVTIQICAPYPSGMPAPVWFVNGDLKAAIMSKKALEVPEGTAKPTKSELMSAYNRARAQLRRDGLTWKIPALNAAFGNLQRRNWQEVAPKDDSTFSLLTTILETRAQHCLAIVPVTPQERKNVMYPHCQKCHDVFDRWTPIAAGHRSPTSEERALMDVVQQALDSGLFYNRDVDKYVKDHASFISPEAWTIQDGVEGGVMGYEVYHARDALEKIATRAENEEAVKLYSVGQKIGTLYINGKRTNALVVDQIDGTSVIMLGKAGTSTVQVTISARGIASAKERAIKRGWCKA